MKSNQTQTSLYKDTVVPLNNAWDMLVQLYGQGDTRVGYLRTFELTLSPNCPDEMLWQCEEYKAQEKLAPLPKDNRTRIDPDIFKDYLLVYEQIMRRVGLIDKDPLQSQALESVELLNMEV